MADKEQIAQIILLLSSLPNYPDRETALLIDVYSIVLGDIPAEELQVAAKDYLSKGRFFPTPGDLRQAVLDLRMTASGVPTAAEAWADVQGALRHIAPQLCPVAERLRSRAIRAVEVERDGQGYDIALNAIMAHDRTCSACRGERTEEVYRHTLVRYTVRRLGGRAALFTDNPAADRARFIEAYNAILEAERKEAGRLPDVANWLEARTQEEMKRLADKLKK